MRLGARRPTPERTRLLKPVSMRAESNPGPLHRRRRGIQEPELTGCTPWVGLKKNRPGPLTRISRTFGLRVPSGCWRSGAVVRKRLFSCRGLVPWTYKPACEACEDFFSALCFWGSSRLQGCRPLAAIVEPGRSASRDAAATRASENTSTRSAARRVRHLNRHQSSLRETQADLSQRNALRTANVRCPRCRPRQPPPRWMRPSGSSDRCPQFCLRTIMLPRALLATFAAQWNIPHHAPPLSDPRATSRSCVESRPRPSRSRVGRLTHSASPI